jgi:hypothetical protein
MSAIATLEIADASLAAAIAAAEIETAEPPGECALAKPVPIEMQIASVRRSVRGRSGTNPSRIMEAQRQVCPDKIGGAAVETIVTREDIRQKVFRRWYSVCDARRGLTV